MNLNEKVKYWYTLASEDMEVAQGLLDIGKLLYAGFICHLAVEKALKAKIESIGETPLKIHNLIRLAEMGGLLDIMTEKQVDLLKLLNPLQIEARYPAYKQQIAEILTTEQCEDMLNQARELIVWIEKQL
jgi:HEPN domain-containing protein